MKKLTALFVALALVGSMGLVSCKKCSTCIAKDKTTGTQIATSGEFCGTKTYVEDTEDTFKSTWGLVSDVTCD